MADFLEIYHQLWRMHLIASCRDLIFPEFALEVDGTPSFAPAEATKVRAVTKNWEIVSVLLRIALLNKAPDAEGLASSIEETMSIFGLLPQNLRAVMKDRAATNQAAVNLLQDKYCMTWFPADCNPHTVKSPATLLLLQQPHMTF